MLTNPVFISEQTDPKLSLLHGTSDMCDSPRSTTNSAGKTRIQNIYNEKVMLCMVWYDVILGFNVPLATL